MKKSPKGSRKIRLKKDYKMDDKEEGFPMYPDEECTVIDENIFIHKAKWEGCPYRVIFNVDCQFFHVGMDFDELEDAKWHADMLKIALNKIRK